MFYRGETQHRGMDDDSMVIESLESSDSEDERVRRLNVNEKHVQRQLNKYFLLIPRRSDMAMRTEESRIPDQEMITQNSQPIPHNVSMSDLVLPDHVGWLTDQSEHKRVWGVVVDMMFCVFENEDSKKPLEVLLLPGCNIRPLVYKTAINGINGRRHSKTITGVAKFQIVIDNLSKRQKHLFSFDTQHELDTWYKVLKQASNLDPDSTIDVASGDKTDSQTNETTESSSRDVEVDKKGYMPSNNTLSRVQKLSKSSKDGPRDKVTSRTADEAEDSPNTSLNATEKPSPRSHGVRRTDSKSVQDFRKLLRRDGETETAGKQLPVKAQHFAAAPSTENKSPSGKKLRSFGSFESLLKFKKKRKKKDVLGETISNDETGSIASTSSSVDFSKSADFSAPRSQLKKSKTKQLSRSLDMGTSRNGLSSSLVRRASDIKDRVFPSRPSKRRSKLGDLHDVTIHGYLYHKHHLKWQKLWCVVCRGCFYGFKSQSPDDCAQVAVVLANCAVVYVSEQEKRAKRLYVFKLCRENAKSVYLCAREHEELQEWLQVLQFESNNVQCDLADLLGRYNNNIADTASSTSGTPRPEPPESRSRSKKKKRAPGKPRHSSCPPPETRDPATSERGRESSTDDCWTSGSSQTEEGAIFGSTDDLPRHDRSVTHVWQNERGYLFNVIRAKMSAYRRRQEGAEIYNTDLPGPGNEGLLLLTDQTKKGSREVRRSRSFSAHSATMEESPPKPTTSTPTTSPTSMRRRHKPLVVKRVPAGDLEPTTMAGYMDRKSFNGQWNKYWYVLHEGTLFCYLTSDDNVTVDVLNLHGYDVTEMVDKFRLKRFVIQLSHEKFTSLFLSLETREEMATWRQQLLSARQRPSSTARDDGDDDKGACAGCESNRADDMKDKRTMVKQKLLDEMLRQKHELERKQAERQKRQRGKDPDTDPSRSNDFTADEQRTSDVTRLRQRRMSTQLKVDAIEKQMVPKSTNQKRGLFSFGKQKKVDENKNIFLQDQLKELCGKLDKIDTDLSHVRQETPLEVYDVNQNRKKSAVVCDQELTSFLNGEADNDVITARTSSGLKAAMHKLTNKTFSKTSTKRKGIPANKPPHNGSVPNLSKQNGDVRSHSYDDNDTNTEGYMSSDNSVTDLTRPTADLKLDLDLQFSPTSTVGSQSSVSPTSTHSYARSNSRNSSGSLPSPRREIKASVLAEIDAFEEMTRQVLGARSKEMPTA